MIMMMTDYNTYKPTNHYEDDVMVFMNLPITMLMTF